MSRPPSHKHTSRTLGIWLSVFLLVALVFVSLFLGKYPISWGELVTLLVAKMHGSSVLGTPADTVVFQIRLPRISAAILVGAALAAAGATYQSLFRNPLASPDILGVSAGAGLGAALGIYLSLSTTGVKLLAFVFGMGTVGLVFFVSSMVRRHDPTLVLVLAGVAVGSLAGACLSLLKYLADPYDQLPAITFWLLGSLSTVDPSDIRSSLVLAGLGLTPLFLLRWRMNVMTLGEDEARALGVDTRRLRLVIVAAATLITAAAVSISGVIGWVGLMIPHMARMLVGPDFSRLLPASMVLGSAYLLAIDDLARTLTNNEVPLGILTAFIGAPFFLWLLARTGKNWR